MKILSILMLSLSKHKRFKLPTYLSPLFLQRRQNTIFLQIMPRIIGKLALYDLAELSTLLGMNKKSLLERYIRTGLIKAKKFGVKWYVTESSLQEYFASADNAQKPVQ